MSTGFQVFVFLHLLCVIAGFGAVAYNGLHLSLAQRRVRDARGAIEVATLISGLAELFIYGAFVFGVAAVGASGSRFTFGQAWVSAAFALFLVDVGILHAWIKPTHRRYVAVLAVLEQATGLRPPEVAHLRGLERRVAFGWGAFNLVVLVVVYLMVFKPGA